MSLVTNPLNPLMHVSMYVCVYVCMYVCSFTGTNLWLYTDLAVPRELSVPILVQIILILSICEKCLYNKS